MNDKAILSLTLSQRNITSIWLDGRLPGVHASLFGTSMNDSGSQRQKLVQADKPHEWWKVIFSDDTERDFHIY